MQEEDRIKAVICTPLFDSIKSEILSGTISPENKILLSFINPAVAYYTIARALLHLDVKITPEGIQAFSTSDRMTQEIRQPAELQRIANLSHRLTEDADAKITQLRNYLYNNLASYPLFESSPCYVPPANIPAPDTDSPVIIFP
jgi:hypothetical protein